MRHLLFLAHRLPYPPNKGDKIRAWAWLRHLAGRFAVHLACPIDDEDDWRHAETVRALCASAHFSRLDPRVARLRGLRGLLDGRALTFPYFHDAGLAEWVAGVQRNHDIEIEFAFSSALAPALGPRRPNGPRRVIDFVDVDSDKWDQYARASRGPLAWLYAREARLLAEAERRLTDDADIALLVSEPEAALFRSRVRSSTPVVALSNGVDPGDAAEDAAVASPYPADGAPRIVFTGAMDYRPNIDAVRWFATEVLPRVRAGTPDAGFWIVGARPARAVERLAELPGVMVTGRVAEIRPYLVHAEVAVAPLRIARGLQNKVLEAMAAGRPVVATSQAFEGLEAVPGRDLLVADDAPAFAQAVSRLLVQPGTRRRLGARAALTVRERYRWSDRLDQFDRLLEFDETPLLAAGGRR